MWVVIACLAAAASNAKYMNLVLEDFFNMALPDLAGMTTPLKSQTSMIDPVTA